MPLCTCGHITLDHDQGECQGRLNGRACGCLGIVLSGTEREIDAVALHRTKLMPGYSSRLEEWLQ